MGQAQMTSDSVDTTRIAEPAERIASDIGAEPGQSLRQDFSRYYGKLPDPVLIVDRQRRVIYWNPPLAQLLDLPVGRGGFPCPFASVWQPSRHDVDPSAIDR